MLPAGKRVASRRVGAALKLNIYIYILTEKFMVKSKEKKQLKNVDHENDRKVLWYP